MDALQKEDETLEDLQLNGLKILQKTFGFRFGMDSVLLADFAQVRPTDHVADFGTGTGILPLLLIGRGKGRCFEAIEIQQEYCEMAERTIRINGLENRIHIIHGDAGLAADYLPPCSMDCVICNPPYGIAGSTLSSPFPDRAAARSQSPDTLERFFNAAFRILKGKGKLFLVYPAPQMLSMMLILLRCHLQPKRFRMVYPQADKPSNLVLMEAVKDARPMLHPMPPLIIYEKDHTLTKELQSVYHIEQNMV